MGTPLFGAQSSARLKGGIGGAQTGYNLQAGIWFAGLETDIQFATQRNITTSLCPGAVRLGAAGVAGAGAGEVGAASSIGAFWAFVRYSIFGRIHISDRRQSKNREFRNQTSIRIRHFGDGNSVGH
jgi:hypothetical protein